MSHQEALSDDHRRNATYGTQAHSSPFFASSTILCTDFDSMNTELGLTVTKKGLCNAESAESPVILLTVTGCRCKHGTSYSLMMKTKECERHTPGKSDVIIPQIATDTNRSDGLSPFNLLTNYEESMDPKRQCDLQATGHSGDQMNAGNATIQPERSTGVLEKGAHYFLCHSRPALYCTIQCRPTKRKRMPQYD